MKHVLLALAFLAPTLAAAYPNPNTAISISASDLIDSALPQPNAMQLVLAGGVIVPKANN